jgi:hypothetical protein
MAAASILVLVGVHVYMAWDSVIPIYWDDEMGYLSNALVLAGHPAPDLGGQSYYLGWSFVLTPIWWFTTDPAIVYRAAIVLSVIAGIALVIPLALIARRLGVALPWAITMGAVVAVAPARALMSNFVLAENFLALVVALCVWAALRFAARKTVGRAATLGLLSSLVFLTHGRATPILIATGLWFLVTLRRSPRASIVGIATAVIPSIGGFLLYRGISSLMYHGGVDRETAGLDRLFSPDVAALFKAFSGQTWYSDIAWLGLSVFGTLVLGARLWREIRRRRLGVGTWAMVALIGVVIISATFTADPISRAVPRIDILSYGRYLDPFLAVLSLLGLVALWKRPRKRVWVAAIAITAVLGVIQHFVLQPTLTTSPTRWWAPISVAGLLQYPWPNVSDRTIPPYTLATAVVLVLLVVAFVLRRFRRILVVALLIAMAGSSVVAEVRTIRPFFDHSYSTFTMRESVREFKDDPISFDLSGLGAQRAFGTKADVSSRNAFQFWLAGSSVPVFDSSKKAPSTELVISRRDWPLAKSLGAKLVLENTDSFDDALWVLPGALQDKLAADGRLLDSSASG